MPKLGKQIKIIHESQQVEALLGPFRSTIGADYEGYRNHIYRVLSYTLHFLNGQETERELIETALVYHDLGLWTERELAYLEPSSALALADNQKHGWGHEPELLHQLIFQHHKLSAYRGPNAALINAMRKADWIDASMGFRAMGMPRSCIREVTRAIPVGGFYDTLKRLGPELSGGNLARMLGSFSKVYKV